MQPSFLFDVDVPRDLMRITLAGFFSPADLAAFRVARSDAHRQLACEPNQHLSIVDIRDMKIQSQDVVAGFEAILAEPQYHARRIAFVAGSSLARSQLRRIVQGRATCFFESYESAEAWLMDDRHQAA